MWGDLLLVLNKTGQEEFNTEPFRMYLRYAAIQGGLFGLFTEKTPRQIIEGYVDPLVYSLTLLPVYTGGDATNSPFLSLTFGATNPPNNSIAFLQGSGDDKHSYLLTRTYVKWLGQATVAMSKNDYTSLNVTEPVLYNPWRVDIPVNGSDGNQFHPNVEPGETLFAFVSNFARTATFVYGESNRDAYKDGFHSAIEMMNFYLSDDVLDSKNPANAPYNTQYDGSINLNTVFNAQAIGTKGHFLDVSGKLATMLPSIKDHNGNEIKATKEEHGTVLGVEKYSGAVIQARQRIQINFMVNGMESSPNGLFSQFKKDTIFPFVFVKRDSIMTNDQVMDILGDLVTAAKIRAPILVSLILFGLLLVVAGSCILKRLQNLVIDENSYESLERKKLVDESTYKNGLGVQRDTYFSNSEDSIV